MAYEDRYKELEQYLASGEPRVEERARNWSIAIGLQDVDGLKPSEFLVEQAKANIEGKISSEEVGRRLEEYYSQKSIREKAETDGTLEADKVADRINLLLAERAFTFSPAELTRIHRFLFNGVLPKAGCFRDYNISKNQWILDGESIEYGSAGSLSELLTFDFSEEKKYNYSKHTAVEAINHIVRFISGIWQIHAFGEGNTRTTAVFLIKYLRSFGFDVNNESFANHSWFFRNALVRSQYENIPKGIHRTFEPLERFMNFAVFGIPADLRNRTLHIRWEESKSQDELAKPDNAEPNVIQSATQDASKSKICTLNCTLEEAAVLKCIESNPKMTQKEMAFAIRKSERTVKTITSSLVEEGIIIRRNGRRNGWWEILSKE